MDMWVISLSWDEGCPENIKKDILSPAGYVGGHKNGYGEAVSRN